VQKKLLLFLFLPILIFTFAACHNTVDLPENAAPPKDKGSYKHSMKPLEELVPAERIVILQSVFNPNTREGFYTRETRPATVEINYNGAKTEAYPISHAIDLLRNGVTGTVAVTGAEGGKTEFSQEDFRGMYVIVDFKAGTPPSLYNPATGGAVPDFAYAVTGGGEAIYSVVGGSYHNINTLLAKVGWKTGLTYRLVATDRFYVPAEPEATATGELRGGLSGVVNGSLPDMKVASGKINDVLYIEAIVE